MKMTSLVQKAAKDRSGAVAIFFALALVPLLLIGGGAIDITRMFTARAKMQSIADAAALAGASNPYATDEAAIKTAKQFVSSSDGGLEKGIKPKYAVTRNSSDTEVSVTVKSTATVPTSVLAAVGFKSFDVAVVATAGRKLNTVDIYVAVDMSASMGIAADETNRAKLVALTTPISTDGRGCAFACHYPDPVVPVPQGNKYDFAKANNIRLREDVLNDAFGAYVDEMLNPNDDQVKFGARRLSTYGFSYLLKKLSDFSTNKTTVRDSLKTYPNANRISTSFSEILPALTKEVGVSGNGSQGNPKKMVFLITDGVEWKYWGLGVTNGAFQAKYCDDLKSHNVEIAVLNVKYFNDVSDLLWFVPYIQPFYPNIAPGLKGCASPGLYFEVADSAQQQLADAFAQVAKAMKPKLSLTR